MLYGFFFCKSYSIVGLLDSVSVFIGSFNLKVVFFQAIIWFQVTNDHRNKQPNTTPEDDQWNGWKRLS